MMELDLEYYLFYKKSLDEIIQHLDSIINIYQNIDDNIYIAKEWYTDKTNIIKNVLKSSKNNNRLFFVERKKHIEEIRNKCNNKVIELCCHNFIDDTIDVSPDKSINIRYCSICEYTEK